MDMQEEVRVTWGTGIAGYVAESGEPVNIPDAYEVSWKKAKKKIHAKYIQLREEKNTQKSVVQRALEIKYILFLFSRRWLMLSCTMVILCHMGHDDWKLLIYAKREFFNRIRKLFFWSFFVVLLAVVEGAKIFPHYHKRAPRVIQSEIGKCLWMRTHHCSRIEIQFAFSHNTVQSHFSVSWAFNGRIL